MLLIPACGRNNDTQTICETAQDASGNTERSASTGTPPDPFRDMTVLSEEKCETDNCACGQWRCRNGEVCKEVIMPYSFVQIAESSDWLYGRQQLKMCFCGEHPGCGYGTCRDGECYDHKNRFCNTEQKIFVPCWNNEYLDEDIQKTAYKDSDNTCGRFSCVTTDDSTCGNLLSVPAYDGKFCGCNNKYETHLDMPFGGLGCIEGECSNNPVYVDGGCLCNGELCPKQYSCYHEKCTCGTALCKEFETCEMEMCVSGTVALGDVDCQDGTCLCAGIRCEGYEVCVKGQCLCQGIKCDDNEYCNVEGRCVSRNIKPKFFSSNQNSYYPPARYDSDPFVFTVRVLYDNVDVCYDINPKPDMGNTGFTAMEIDCHGKGHFLSVNSKTICCTEMTRGFHTIAVRGNVDGIQLKDGKAVRKETLSKEPVVVFLTESIDQWGNTEWRNFSEWFGGSNLVLRATDIPDLTRIRHLDISAFKWVNDSTKNWKISSQVKVSESSKQYFPQLSNHEE